MPLTPQDFVSKWKRVTAREKQTYQEHFLDLCRLVGHPTPNEYDGTGDSLRHSKWVSTLPTSASIKPSFAYSWNPDLSDEEILEKLPALNLEWAK